METPRYWRLKKQKYRLVGEKCPHCDEFIFPPRDICPNRDCGKNTFTFPLISRAEKKYYNEKGIKFEEKIKETRVDIKKLIYQ